VCSSDLGKNLKENEIPSIDEGNINSLSVLLDNFECTGLSRLLDVLDSSFKKKKHASAWELAINLLDKVKGKLTSISQVAELSVLLFQLEKLETQRDDSFMLRWV
jgi:hypothetical protein